LKGILFGKKVDTNVPIGLFNVADTKEDNQDKQEFANLVCAWYRAVENAPADYIGYVSNIIRNNTTMLHNICNGLSIE